MPESYIQALAFAQNPIGKLIVLAVISLSFWHGAERVFLTLKDMKAGPVEKLKMGTYGVAAAVTLLTCPAAPRGLNFPLSRGPSPAGGSRPLHSPQGEGSAPKAPG